MTNIKTQEPIVLFKDLYKCSPQVDLISADIHMSGEFLATLTSDWKVNIWYLGDDVFSNIMSS
jgi:hypothetical protein